MLQALIESRTGAQFYQQPNQPHAGGIMNMFGDSAQSQSTQHQNGVVTPAPQQMSDPNAITSLFTDEDETLKDDDTKDAPKVEIIDY